MDEFAVAPEAIHDIAKSVEGVERVYKIRPRWIGKLSAIDLVISVDPMLTVEKAHYIADQVESLLEQELDISDISIHLEPEFRSESSHNLCR